MDLTKLRYFYIVAKHEHVTKAAEEIHIAQPALTKSIKELEERLGVPLFYKKGRNIRLTVFGEYLKNKLSGVFTHLDGIPDEIENLKTQAQNTVKINVLAASMLITEAVIGYKKKHPHVIFQIIQNETEADCDISVTTSQVGLGALPSFTQKQVLTENIYLAVQADGALAQRESVELSEVKEEEFVSLAGSRQFRRVCDGFCAQAGFQPKTVFESDSIVAVRNIISAHVGLAFWPQYSWGKASADVKLLPITKPECKRELVLGLHENPVHSAVAIDFYDYLVRFMQKRSRR